LTGVEASRAGRFIRGTQAMGD